jgi:serine protease
MAGVVAGALLTAAPRAGQQPDQLPGRQASGKPAVQGPGVPVVAVPRVTVPSIVPPSVTPGQPPPAAAQTSQFWMSAARAEAFVQAERLGVDYLPGEVLVKFKDGVGADGQTRALQVLAGRPTADSIEWAGQVGVVRDAMQPNAYVLADQLKGQPEVEYAEPNFIAKIDPLEQAYARNVAPPPRVYSLRPTRGGGNISGQPTDTDYVAYQWNFQLINMPGAWDIQGGGRSDLIVAVIDTGISGGSGTLTYPIWTGSSFQTVSMPYAANPDLPVSRHTLAKDYVGSQVSPAPPLVDLDGHGTHVSGTIGEATNNALLAAGMAYNVKIMPLKVCAGYWDVMIARGLAGITGFASSTAGGCAYSDMAAAVQYAVDNGARVMNMSIGGTGGSTTLQSALQSAAAKGAFISISMGNEYEKGNPTMYPSSYASGIDGVMSVAAVGYNSAKAYYSSTGSYCEIAAPGGDSRSGSGRTDGGLIWQSTILSSDRSSSLLVPRFDRYDKQGYQGTSMAAPHVAGMAALLMSQMPSLTSAQVEQIIRTMAKDLGTAGRDDSFGYGLIQPRTALYGYGIRK